ncbi:MAG: hypothetical protein ONB46_09290 [candidate division KSB1 bacterium]|nr:hypothetical protein [candidate division KSB1 bacterium]MDZ7365995.1 hypothetical protein [candidate division KSB1 bacterium]MDZ7404112.1 hypothetical protein [candidate division KSB1 bacterium]
MARRWRLPCTCFCCIAPASTYAFVNPVVAVILGLVILNEPITAGLIVGAALVILALIVIQRAKLRKQH